MRVSKKKKKWGRGGGREKRGERGERGGRGGRWEREKRREGREEVLLRNLLIFCDLYGDAETVLESACAYVEVPANTSSSTLLFLIIQMTRVDVQHCIDKAKWQVLCRIYIIKQVI